MQSVRVIGRTPKTWGVTSLMPHYGLQAHSAGFSLIGMADSVPYDNSLKRLLFGVRVSENAETGADPVFRRTSKIPGGRG